MQPRGRSALHRATRRLPCFRRLLQRRRLRDPGAIHLRLHERRGLPFALLLRRQHVRSVHDDDGPQRALPRVRGHRAAARSQRLRDRVCVWLFRVRPQRARRVRGRGGSLRSLLQLPLRLRARRTWLLRLRVRRGLVPGRAARRLRDAMPVQRLVRRLRVLRAAMLVLEGTLALRAWLWRSSAWMPPPL